MTATTYAYTITIPDTLNDGTPVLDDYFETLESRFCDVFGGFLHVLGLGGFKGEHRVYHEAVTVYQLHGTHDHLAWLLALAEDVKRDLKQEAVYITRANLDAWMV
jgi:hypothetical protein